MVHLSLAAWSHSQKIYDSKVHPVDLLDAEKLAAAFFLYVFNIAFPAPQFYLSDNFFLVLIFVVIIKKMYGLSEKIKRS